MGLRIIGKTRKKPILEKNTVREKMLRVEAEKFSIFKGGDLKKSQKEFLDKINDIQISLSETKKIITRLEKKMKTVDFNSMKLQREFDLNIILNLLDKNI